MVTYSGLLQHYLPNSVETELSYINQNRFYFSFKFFKSEENIQYNMLYFLE